MSLEPSPYLIEVAVRTPLRKKLTYAFDRPLAKGVRVRVPFRSREILGFAWGLANEAQPPKGLKAITSVLDEVSPFDDRTLVFYERAASYYGMSLGDLLGASIPKRIQEGRALGETDAKKFDFRLVELSSEQKDVVCKIESLPGFDTHLLMGETGSGKTEVYLELFKNVLEQGGQCLFLVPEISLTPQFEQRLKARLGASVSVFHSQLTEKKREETFARAAEGSPDIFLGARSALFLPFKNLKMIVVDEEHDASYKQNERGCYHARDLAILRAQILSIPCVLGSATPSLESYERATKRGQTIHRLNPYFAAPSVDLKVVDLKATWKRDEKSFISPVLHEAVAETLEKNEQVLLFLNRRGSASQRICVSCGEVQECRQCSVALTLHRDLHRLICHWCGYQASPQSPCTKCQANDFFEGGIGTKEVEAQMRARFPEARIARLDRDETIKRDYLEKIIDDFSGGRIDILVGTQMISKGIDISKLSLVGLILADMGWGIPDFRAAERAFQLLKQLKGRVGRRGQASQMVVQTFSPDHPLFEWLRADDPYREMQSIEMDVRRAGRFPPYTRLILFTFSHRQEDSLETETNVWAHRMRVIAKHFGIEVWGPTPAPLRRWKGLFRMQVLVRGDEVSKLTAFLTAVLDEMDRKGLGGLKCRWDRDPQHFL